jgi:hypothetical protein
MLAKPDLQLEAIRLRVEERLSVREIAAKICVAKSSVSCWVRQHPLTEEEKSLRSKLAKRYVPPKKDHGERSKHFLSCDWENLSCQQRGRIAEQAILFRLSYLGLMYYRPNFDGDKIDCLVRVPENGNIHILQIRCVNKTQHGLPVILLTCTEGHNVRRRYKEGEFDFIAGYYLFNDTAYVYSFDEVANNKTTVTISPDHAERWDKLKA